MEGFMYAFHPQFDRIKRYDSIQYFGGHKLCVFYVFISNTAGTLLSN